MAEAIRTLIQDMGKLGEAGTVNAGKLDALSAQIRTNLAEVEQMANKADEREQALIEALALASSELATFENTAGRAKAEVRSASEEMVAQLGDVSALLGEVDDKASLAGTSVATLQASLREQAALTSDVGNDLVARAVTVKDVSSTVMESLKALVAEVESLNTRGEKTGETIASLSAQVVEALSQVDAASGKAEASERKLLQVLEIVQNGFTDLDQDVHTLRDGVTSLSDHAKGRLGEVMSLFSDRMSAGEMRLDETMARLTQAGDLARDQASALEDMAGRIEGRLSDAVSVIEDKRGIWDEVTGHALSRLDDVGERMDKAVDRSADAHKMLVEQVKQNEHVVRGLGDLSRLTQETLEETMQRMAMLAQQAASESGKMAEITSKIEQQQAAMRHAAEAAVAMMQSVETQMRSSGDTGVEVMSAAEGRMSDVMAAMTERLSSLARQNEDLMKQLAEASEGYVKATEALRASGASVGGELGAASVLLRERAEGLVVVGQKFDEDLRTRLSNVETTRESMDRYFSGFGRQLAELDTRTSGYLIDLEKRSEEGFSRLRLGVDQLSELPVIVTQAKSQLAAQVEAAKSELAGLRQDLLDVSAAVEAQVAAATSHSGEMLGQLREVGVQSQTAAQDLEQVSRLIVEASEKAWKGIRAASGEGLEGLSEMLNSLGKAQDKTENVVMAVREGVDTLLGRIEVLSDVVDQSLNGLAERYQSVTTDGLKEFESLGVALQSGAERLESSTGVARETFAQAVAMLSSHQEAIGGTSARLGEQMASVRAELERLREEMGTLDTRVERVGPVLVSQQARLDGFLASVDKTLAQVVSLQEQTKVLAGEHLSLAAKIQEQENTLLATAGALGDRLGQIDKTTSGSMLVRLQQAAEQAQTVEARLDQLTGQSERLDRVLSDVRQSLENDVKALQSAEEGVSGVAERAAEKLLEVGSALNATLNQLQKGGQLSHAGLVQSNEETQRLVSRLEQVRGLIKTMMDAVSGDLDGFHGDIKHRLGALSQDIAAQLGAAKRTMTALPSPSRSSSLGVSAATAGATQAALARIGAAAHNADELDDADTDSPASSSRIVKMPESLMREVAEAGAIAAALSAGLGLSGARDKDTGKADGTGDRSGSGSSSGSNSGSGDASLPLPRGQRDGRKGVRSPALSPMLASSASRLTAEALNALAVDLYRLIHAASADLRKEMMPPLTHQKPMTPEDARAYTRTLLDLKRETLQACVKGLYDKNADFRQYVARYLERFEGQYDALVNGEAGSIAAGVMWRASEPGQLYVIMSEALGRKIPAVDRVAIGGKSLAADGEPAKRGEAVSS